MSKINTIDYRYRVCPICKSKRLKPVGIVRFGPDKYYTHPKEVKRTGFLCDNCERYHSYHGTKFIYDRAEMRRDAMKLLAFLDGGAK
jgi:hypothetical protein